MRKISWGQVLILLLLSRIYTLMTYVPLVGKGYSASSQIIGIIISTLCHAILIVPIISLYKIYPNKSIVDIAFEKNKILGLILSAIYALYFLFSAINSITHYGYFISNVYFPITNKVVAIIFLVILCVYATYLGIEAIARSSSIIFLVFIAMLLVFIVGSSSRINMLNVYFDSDESINAIVKATYDDFSRCSEVVAIAMLMPFLKNKINKAFYGYLACRLVIIELISFIILAVLGTVSGFIKFPFLVIGSYSKFESLQRLDAIYMIVWTLTAVINISLYFFITADLLKHFTSKSWFIKALVGVISLGFSIPTIIFKLNLDSIYQQITGAIPIIILFFIIPFILLLITSKGGAKNDTKKKTLRSTNSSPNI